MDKRLIRLITILFFLSLVLIYLLFPVLVFSINKQFYLYRFEKYHVYQDFELTEISKSEAIKNFNELVQYLYPYSQHSLNEKFFSTEDIFHLYDVKLIINNLAIIFLISLITSLVIIKKLKKYINFKEILTLSKCYILVILLVTVSIFIFFDQVFTLAHQIAFDNNYWLLNPETSNLIKYFPQEIFQEVFGIIIFINLLLHFFTIILIRKNYEKTNRR